MASDLLKGLSILYDMELNDYLMLQTIDKLNYEISWRGKPNNTIKAPKKESAWFDFELFCDWVKGAAGIFWIFLIIYSLFLVVVALENVYFLL